MNISSPDILHECTSCQMCAAVCPTTAIGISLSHDGFYRPTVNPAKCIDCGLCVQVCYKYDTKIILTDQDALNRMTLWAAVAKDDMVVAETTSGGIADLLARQLVEKGYQCIGVGYDSNLDIAYDTIARKYEEVQTFRGSKYIQSYTLPAFRELVKDCKKKKFAVFGTPCHIYAVDKYLNFRGVRNNSVLIDLYCHGCPSLYLWRKYVCEIKSLVGASKFDVLNFRSKIKGWGNFCVVGTVKGVNAFVSSPRKDEFYTLFFSDTILNGACNTCHLRSTLAYTDIRLGDFWGKRYALNIRGMSAVSVISPAGRDLLESISGKIVKKKEEYKDFLRYQSWGKIYMPNIALRKELLQQISDPAIPLIDSVRTLYQHRSLIRKWGCLVKQVTYYLPIRLVALIKWVYY